MCEFSNTSLWGQVYIFSHHLEFPFKRKVLLETSASLAQTWEHLYMCIIGGIKNWRHIKAGCTYRRCWGQGWLWTWPHPPPWRRTAGPFGGAGIFAPRCADLCGQNCISQWLAFSFIFKSWMSNAAPSPVTARAPLIIQTARLNK